MNKDEAKAEMREQRSDPKPSKKRSAFVAKLYRDEDDLQELKVLAGGDDNIDSDFEEKDDEVPVMDADDKPKKRE